MRLLLRAEALASSAIEGLRASAEAVALAEAAAADAGGFDDPVAAWVADNLAVVSDALADPCPLDEARLFGWHARLMRNSPTIDDRHVGAYRDTLGWVGGANPLVAAHVAVPHEDIAALMRDLFVTVSSTSGCRGSLTWSRVPRAAPPRCSLRLPTFRFRGGTLSPIDGLTPQLAGWCSCCRRTRS